MHNEKRHLELKIFLRNYTAPKEAIFQGKGRMKHAQEGTKIPEGRAKCQAELSLNQEISNMWPSGFQNCLEQ